MAKQKGGRKADGVIAVSIARIRLAELVNRAEYAGERFVIVRRGKPIAAIIGAKDMEAFAALEKDAA